MPAPKSTPTNLFPHLPPDKRKDPYRTLPGLARLILAATITPMLAHKIFSTTNSSSASSSSLPASKRTSQNGHPKPGTVAATAKFSKSALKHRAISCWLAVDFVFRMVREMEFARQARSRLDLDHELGRAL